MFYWVADTFSKTLGTALGDFLADDGGLRLRRRRVVFRGGLALLAAAYFFTRISRAAYSGSPSS